MGGGGCGAGRERWAAAPVISAGEWLWEWGWVSRQRRGDAERWSMQGWEGCVRRNVVGNGAGVVLVKGVEAGSA